MDPPLDPPMDPPLDPTPDPPLDPPWHRPPLVIVESGFVTDGAGASSVRVASLD